MRSRRKAAASGLVAMLALLVFLPSPALAYQRPSTIERVSVASDGSEAVHYIFRHAISADGRFVAFDSNANNLVPDDTNNATDVFVRDRVTGANERVSVATDGSEGSGYYPAISADGRYVLFQSASVNFVPDDTAGTPDLFVHDRVAGTTERVVMASDGSEGAAVTPPMQPVISADGRYVAFASDATTLVSGDTNDVRDVFVHDRVAGTTERVTVATGGIQGDGASHSAAISADARYVAFASAATTLIPGDTNDRTDVFVRDRATGTTERVSVATDGTPGGGSSPAISADGTHVAFSSFATLVPGDTNDKVDVFVHDRDTGITERVSVASDGSQLDGDAGSAVISDDGRHVAFARVVPEKVDPGEDVFHCSPRCEDVFVHHRDSGVTGRVSESAGGVAGDRDSFTPAISGDADHVAFISDATNLVAGKTNSCFGSFNLPCRDVYVRERGPAVGVGALEVQKSSGELTVSGWARFSGAIMASAEDSADDGAGVDRVTASEMGAEITGASVTFRPEQEDLLVRLHLDGLPRVNLNQEVRWLGPGATVAARPHDDAGWPQVVYRLGFTLDGTRYEVRAQHAAARHAPDGAPLAPYFGLYECAPACTESVRLSGGIGTTGSEVRVAVPIGTVGTGEEVPLIDLTASTAVGEVATGPLVGLDDVDLPDTVIPPPRVELGLASASTPQDEVTFPTQGEVFAGEFVGTLPTSGLPAGDYRVWARACVADVCGTRSVSVRL